MSNDFKIIGSDKIKSYQLTIIIIGLFLCLLIFPFYLMENNTNSLMILLLSIGLFIAFGYAYSNLYTVKIDKFLFYFTNLYFKRTEKISDFTGITVLLRLPYVLRLTFNNGNKYLFMLDSKDSFSALFSTERKVLDKIKKQLNEKMETANFNVE